VNIKYRELKRRYELDGAQKTVDHLAESLREKHLRPEDLASAIWPKRSCPMVINGCDCSIRGRPEA
jgi:hypothetical protein